MRLSPSRDIGQPFTNVSFLCAERGYDDCLLGSQIDGYYKYEPLGGKREELDKAATKIQATFRGHKARQEAQASVKTESIDDLGEGELPLNTGDNFGGKEYGEKEHAAATSIQAGYRGYYTRIELSARNEAATTIQAGYRGYAVRKGLPDNEASTKQLDEDSNDVATNEEEETAATKIQSAFRGHQTRNAISGEQKSNFPVEQGIKDNEVDSSPKDDSVANEQGEEEQKANDSTETAKNEAAIKIQSRYRGYYTRQQLEQKGAAATTIQAYYRGYRVREIRRAKSEAAVKIQSYYRGYRTRERLGKRHSTKTFLDVSTQDDEFALHRDSRTSFSLPEGVKFEGNLDEDSDAEIDKMVDKLTAIKEASSPEIAEEKHDG